MMTSVSQAISSGSGLVLVRATIRIPTNQGFRPRSVKVLVDTGAQHCIASKDLLSDIETLQRPINLRGIAGTTSVTKRGFCSLQVPYKGSSKWMRVSALGVDGPIGNTSSGIELALSASVSRALGLHSQAVINTTTDVSKLPQLHCKRKLPVMALEKASFATSALMSMEDSVQPQILVVAEENEDGQLVLAQQLRTVVREAEQDRIVKWRANEEPVMGLLIDSYIEKSLLQHPLTVKGVQVSSIHDIWYGKPPEDCDSIEEIDRCKKLVAEFEDVFSKEALPSKANFDPIEIELSSNAPLPKIRTTNWSPAERKYLTALRKQWESFGIVQRARGVLAICRLTLARKLVERSGAVMMVVN